MAVERPLSQLNTDPLSPLRTSQSRLNGASIVLHESLVAPEKKKTVPNHLLDTRKVHRQVLVDEPFTLSRKVIPIKCNIPMDFEYQLKFVQPHPAIAITPMTGTVPGNGQVELTATYSPSDFSTAIMKLQLIISQFNTKPLDCTFIGHSSPGLAILQETQHTDTATEGPLSPVNTAVQLDPQCISPISMARRKKGTGKTGKKKTVTVVKPTKDQGTEKNGVRFPANLNVQHSVNAVLLQTPGKLTAKEIREAVQSKSGTAQALNPRQLKEAVFDREVRDDVQAERRNQIRWQVHLGRDQMLQEERLQIVETRKEALKDYHFKRGDPLPEIEFNRVSTTCTQRRTYRRMTHVPDPVAQFDLYCNDPWAMKHRAVGRFQQAVQKVILRQRATDKWSKLSKLVEEYRSGNAGKVEKVTFGNNGEAKYDHLPLEVGSDKLLTYAFPSYISPDYKDDMAPDALGIVPAKATDIEVKRKVPYLGLKVPQQYRLMGYKAHSVLDAASGYVAPKLVRPLRTGAEDETITMPVPEQAWQEKDDDAIVERLEGIDGEDDDEEEQIELVTGEARKTAAQLVPPAGIFKSVDYPSLHIFNPAPGLQVFLPPLPYAEVDPDFHLCPLPRYTHSDPKNKHGATLKRYLDKEDVIKGVMAWKKFPSQGLVSLANTPTLTNVWVPRWTDTFSPDLLPESVPELLDGLPTEDKENILSDDSDDDDEDDEAKQEKTHNVALTPSMVNAEFPLIIAPLAPDQQQQPSESEEFPYGSKLPTHNNPVSSNGPVPREKRERELELFLKKRYNKVGEKIQERVTHMNNLTIDPDLVLH
eukprot:XP_011672418.1 PREDICTED: cilia- and flagella-associated protein 221 [Strongylocentrotus purpuratus]